MTPVRVLAVVLAGVLLLAACSDDDEAAPTAPPTATPEATASPDATSTPTDEPAAAVDLTALPIGEAISSAPQAGAIWACQTTFGGGGASATGDWIHDDGTYDLTAKPLVDGAVDWPHEFEIVSAGDSRSITGNGLPDHPTGEYPISQDDDAYAFDRNPNSISAQDFQVILPQNPQIAAEASCVSMGAIGVLLTGSVFFNALDAAGRDAVAFEIQDSCQGHPEMSGTYHYHSLTSCLEDAQDGGHSSLFGYAFDGFGIYGHDGEGGVTVTNADLDECHGHAHAQDGEADAYHYHATWEYPYTVGCFRGTP